MKKMAVRSLALGCVLASCLVSHAQPTPPGGGGTNGGGGGYYIQPNIPNPQKYMAQSFSLIDTNDAAANNTNLYNAILAFPSISSTSPVLQILPFQANSLIFKASHFDYSGESSRDFTLIVNDRANQPMFTNVNLATASLSTNQYGWLVQGVVPAFQVNDCMYLVVSNISRLYDAFFCVVPYGGPVIQLSGQTPYQTVAGTIPVQATVTDLSGVNGQTFALTVNGLCIPYTITNSTINIQTLYAPNGDDEIELEVQNQNATLLNPTNAVMDQKLNFDNATTLTLDFENPIFVANSGDMTSPDAGTAYTTYGATQNMNITVTISEPDNGLLLSTFVGTVQAGNTVSVPWNFTKSDGVTPYTNDQYVVRMAATPTGNVRPRDGGGGSSTSSTNTIDRHGVRTAGWVIINDEGEDPSTTDGAQLDSWESTWDTTTETMYENLYYTDWLSFTMYNTGDIGPSRDNPSNYGLPYTVTSGNQTSWPIWLGNCVSNRSFSDFNWGPGHANGQAIGSGPNRFWNYVSAQIYAQDVQTWAMSCQPNWRFRKIVMWGCDTANKKQVGNGGTYSGWIEALGTRGTMVQLNSCMWKNVGLFFGDELQSAGYGGGSASAYQVATFLDMMWVEGIYPFPGGCDPTYSFAKICSITLNQYPELNTAKPLARGFPYLPYSGVYDSQLLMNNTSNIKN
jgi:hypothetical protein